MKSFGEAVLMVYFFNRCSGLPMGGHISTACRRVECQFCVVDGGYDLIRWGGIMTGGDYGSMGGGVVMSQACAGTLLFEKH